MSSATNFENVHEILGIKVEPGTEKQFLRELKKAPEVEAAYICLDEYDIIALLDIEDPGELNHFIDAKVRKPKCVVDARITLVK
ncbi:MAG: Lrp/AsnC family transcriptional regulator [Theionarchaea archaeon]|nr:MAG: hypothetical protein AYK19_00705 [Theionarchaea archaeon DG-70-1]MBU7029105.1 Lrp/AsnC family transcriptional regulator [Theionarchaea archaeon]